MILDYIEGPLTGDAWEDLCTKCYRMKYEQEHFTPIPAVHGGDAGIEGFTHTGRVYQCYCPEREYTDNELYDHLRDKMTTDIGKLMDIKYAKRLVQLGVPPIKEWHFVIPFYKDSRIVVHAETKCREVLAQKAKTPSGYEHIHEEFVVVIKQAEDLKVELTRIIRETITDVKLNLAVRHTGNIDWSLCDSKKVENIERKVKAIMGDIAEDEEDYQILVSFYVESYIKGLQISNNLLTSYKPVYEELYELEQMYKDEVKVKTRINTDRSLNSKVFQGIIDEFQQRLEKEFKYFTTASIMQLKNSLVSNWLADCSMQFKG